MKDPEKVDIAKADAPFTSKVSPVVAGSMIVEGNHLLWRKMVP
jgi:hypothetical protein